MLKLSPRSRPSRGPSVKRPGYHNTSGCAPPAAPVAGCAGADQEDAMLLSGSLLSHGFPPPYLGIRRPVKCLREKREFVGDSADAARERSSPTGKFFHRSCCGFRGRADRSSSARLAGMSTGRLASAGYNRATLPGGSRVVVQLLFRSFLPGGLDGEKRHFHTAVLVHVEGRQGEAARTKRRSSRRHRVQQPSDIFSLSVSRRLILKIIGYMTSFQSWLC